MCIYADVSLNVNVATSPPNTTYAIAITSILHHNDSAFIVHQNAL